MRHQETDYCARFYLTMLKEEGGGGGGGEMASTSFNMKFTKTKEILNGY